MGDPCKLNPSVSRYSLLVSFPLSFRDRVIINKKQLGICYLVRTFIESYNILFGKDTGDFQNNICILDKPIRKYTLC